MLGLGFIFRKAQATVDNAIAQLVWGLLMVVPLLVAVGFATAAAASYLHRVYEPEIANLIVAGAYAFAAALMAIIYAVRRAEPAAGEEPKAQDDNAAQSEAADSDAGAAMNAADREVMLAALTTLAPLTIRPVLTALFRNLPIVLAIAVAAFVLTRVTEIAEPGESLSPAE
jgi:type VI protein secretion system component VasK